MVDEGDTIELISTGDEYTKLEPGATGTVTMISSISEEVSGKPGGQKQVWVNWDDVPSKLALLEGEDKWKVIDD